VHKVCKARKVFKDCKAKKARREIPARKDRKEFRVLLVLPELVAQQLRISESDK